MSFMIIEDIIKKINLAIEGCGLPTTKVSVVHPDIQFGDLSTSVAFSLSKEVGKNPNEVAGLIAEKLRGDKSFTSVDVVNGHINMFFSDDVFERDVDQKSKGIFLYKPLKDEKIIVEYTDPNPFKEFHIGHLMTNAIGESFARISQFLGADVKKVNYQGDIGPHVAKCIWALQKYPKVDLESLGKAYAEGAGLYETDESVKKEIDEINVKLYSKEDPEINKLYDLGKKLSLENFEKIYKLLGTKFDAYFFESDTAVVGLEKVKENFNIFRKDGGAVIYSPEDLHTRVFITQKGLPTYETKELGLAFVKEKMFPGRLSYIVTANETKEYMKVVHSALEKIDPDIASRLNNISHGLMKLPSGKMSSRKGEVVTAKKLFSLINENLLKNFPDVNKDNLEKISVATIKFSILQQANSKDIVFDLDKSAFREGDTGPYLQYSFVRTVKLLKDFKGGSFFDSFKKQGSYIYRPINSLLIEFDEVMYRSYVERSSHHLAQYLLRLSHEWNSFYAKEKILNQPDTKEKLKLVKAINSVMSVGIDSLGIETVEAI